MSRSLYFLVAGFVLLCTMPLAAQDAVLTQIYGNGVHAYFNQDYVKAHELFTRAIDAHTDDPRVFYFRGLALVKLGRPQEADNDFQRGAKLESAIDPSRVYNVARALERIQGPERASLEQFRLDARAAIQKKTDEEHRIRYQESLKAERKFLQDQSEAGPAKAVETPPEGVKPIEGGEQPAKGPLPLVHRCRQIRSPPAMAARPRRGRAMQVRPLRSPRSPRLPESKSRQKPEVSTDPFAAPGGAVKPAAADAGGAKKPEVPKPEAPKADAAKPDAGADPFAAPGGAVKPAAADAGGAKKPEVPKPEAPKADAAKPDAGADPFAAPGGGAKPARSRSGRGDEAGRDRS